MFRIRKFYVYLNVSDVIDMPGLFLFNDLHYLRIPPFCEILDCKLDRNAVWYIYILRNSRFLTVFKYELGNEFKLIQKYNYLFPLTTDDLMCRIRLDTGDAVIEECLEILNDSVCIALARAGIRVNEYGYE